MRKLIIWISISILLILGACSENEKNKEENLKAKEASTSEKADEEKKDNDNATTEIKEYSIENLDDLKNYKGSLLSDLTLEEELSTETDELMNSIEEELKKELTEFTEETQNAKELEIKLASLLASPNYEEAIDPAQSFKPTFEEPYLPIPKKVGSGVEQEDEIGKAIILLDASSSMLLSVDGEVKMDIAKDAVKRFTDVIGQDSDISLVVYGHKGSESNSDKKLSCEGIEEVYPMGEYNSDEFEGSLSTFESKGWTPLAGAINKAAEMSQKLEGAITVYIVSDGVETCDGDPVKAAENFAKDNEGRSVNIIGFNVDKDAEDQLKSVSEAGNGDYFAANNADEIQQTIEYEWLPSAIDLAWAFTKAPDPWEELAEMDRYKVEHQRIRDIIAKEDERFDKALKMIYQEELIPSEAYDELSELILNRKQKKIELNDELKSQKYDEIKQVSDDIRKRVDEWVEEMRKIKDE
ncbi:vWA domain-containing protein [Ornithinibacillus scapharcae]|uniref:vWA domain-containing protein n=1 Tax=Ornithinibacillus scapharcae TaxID=1147159 RepID=UPI000225B339|nr:VWA domain-containing protein [Ornithinibacillus scapharcae]